jgi:hypothetical protein
MLPCVRFRSNGGRVEHSSVHHVTARVSGLHCHANRRGAFNRTGPDALLRLLERLHGASCRRKWRQGVQGKTNPLQMIGPKH